MCFIFFLLFQFLLPLIPKFHLYCLPSPTILGTTIFAILDSEFPLYILPMRSIYKDLQGQVDADVISFPPSVACIHQDLDRLDFIAFCCIGFELQWWFPTVFDLDDRNLILWEVKTPLTFTPSSTLLIFKVPSLLY